MYLKQQMTSRVSGRRELHYKSEGSTIWRCDSSWSNSRKLGRTNTNWHRGKRRTRRTTRSRLTDEHQATSQEHARRSSVTAIK